MTSIDDIGDAARDAMKDLLGPNQAAIVVVVDGADAQTVAVRTLGLVATDENIADALRQCADAIEQGRAQAPKAH